MSNQSIYDTILESLTPEGKLPPNFVLPSVEVKSNELRFMPGARDGIGLAFFGTRYPQMAVQKVVSLLNRDWRNGNSGSMVKIERILHKYGVVAIMDPILTSLQNDRKGLDKKNLAEYANRLAFESHDEEVVKLGISLLGLIDLCSEPEFVDRLLKLALYEEFTLFVTKTISKCPNGNDMVFEIAQKVDGWGKIHAVEHLEPDSQEIREWILRKGCSNAVMDTYLGLECAVKGDLIRALRSEVLDDALFDSIGVILDALLDERPVEGISVYVHAEEALRRYLAFATEHGFTVKHLWYILNVKDWLENNDVSSRDDLLSMCEGIVSKTSWLESIRAVLNNPDDEHLFYATSAASRLAYDITDRLFKVISQDPVRFSGYLDMVYQNPEYAKQLTQIYEEVLPLEDMATGMGDLLFPENFPEEHFCLDFLLQALVKYPLLGRRLVTTALQSPVVRERNGACSALEGWSMSLNKPLRTYSPDLYDFMKRIVSKEINRDTRIRMKKLLKG
jgi:hypothetical protein